MESENAGNSRNEPILREERVRRSEVDRPTTSLRRTQRATVPMHLLEFFPEPQQQRIRPLGRQNDDVRSQKALVRRYCPEFAVVRATASHIVEGSKGAVSRKQIESEYNPVSASWLLDRESGAHNPSPVEEKPVRRRGDRSKHGHKDQGLGLLHRRQNRKGKGEASILSSSKCRLVKPLALRIKTPNAVPAPPSFFLGDFVSKSAIQVWPTIRREDSPPLRNSSSMSISPLPVEGTSEGEEKVYLDQRIEVANMLAVVEDDLSVTIETNPCSVTTRLPDFPIQTAVETARDGILHALAVFKGETTSTEFQTALFFLTEHYLRLGTDACRPDQTSTEGVWLTLTKPTFFYCLGENDSGDPMYTLGRMSFDLFSPSETICSLQGNFSRVERVDGRTAALMKSVPKSLYKEVQVGNTVLRTYDVLTAFTIEPSSPDYPVAAPNIDVHCPIRGIMTTRGCILSDPGIPNRHSIWFTGGRIEPDDDRGINAVHWKHQFALHPPKPSSLTQRAKILATNWFMGATLSDTLLVDGAMEYAFARPIGGHGVAFVDTLYVDETLRIVRGHRGTIYVFTRVGDMKT